MVRMLGSRCFKPPWPFVKKGSHGQRKIGPMRFEEHKWPGQNREFPELSPKFQKLNLPALRRYTGVQPTGYDDPVTGKYIDVKEMHPEFIVPDLTGFELKPYVSYKTDVEIEKIQKNFAELVKKKGGESQADSLTIESERWPPPKMNSQTLFDLYYADKVQNAFNKQKKNELKNSPAIEQKINKSNGKFNMRFPFITSKRSLHITPVFFRGPLKHPGYYPRDYKPGPFPNTDAERRAAAIKYGLRPEDYKTISKDDVQRYCGDYPDFGVITYAHKDPYEDWTDSTYRRNWNEQVQKDYLYYRPERFTFTGLEIEDMTLKQSLYFFIQVLGPLMLFFYYAKSGNADSLRWKNPVMPKQYPFDFYRAWPLEDPRNYPIENYSFDPLD